MVEWSNIDNGGRGGRGVSDIPFFVFDTVSRGSFATLTQLSLPGIVWIEGFTVNDRNFFLFLVIFVLRHHAGHLFIVLRNLQA